ncbi:MAG: hypothetical protein HY904_11845 [Deltaproteobacteria bacterium]|nr:hypothetical protein [Deltaproteobacteria bacterium]
MHPDNIIVRSAGPAVLIDPGSFYSGSSSGRPRPAQAGTIDDDKDVLNDLLQAIFTDSERHALSQLGASIANRADVAESCRIARSLAGLPLIQTFGDVVAIVQSAQKNKEQARTQFLLYQSARQAAVKFLVDGLGAVIAAGGDDFRLTGHENLEEVAAQERDSVKRDMSQFMRAHFDLRYEGSAVVVNIGGTSPFRRPLPAEEGVRIDADHVLLDRGTLHVIARAASLWNMQIRCEISTAAFEVYAARVEGGREGPPVRVSHEWLADRVREIVAG